MKQGLLLFLFLPLFALAQNSQITLEDIYKKGTFRGEFVPGFAAEDNSSLFDAKDVKDETGKSLNTSEYEVSADKKRILFFNGREPIYRRSSKATVYVYDVATKKTVSLNKGKVLHPTFSPDGKKIAYVFENNLYLYDIASGKTTAVTTDGKWNNIINGNADWVYEEEFSFSQAYQWSADGAYLAYYKFDESRVKEYNITFYNDEHNREYRYKYPKAGDSNSTVTIHIYNIANGKTVPAKYDQGDIYIPRIVWTTTGDKLVVFWMNRKQNDLKLLQTDPITGNASPLYEEKNKYYVDIDGEDDWHFLKNGKQFLFRSEKNGWSRIYAQSMDGKTETEITKTAYDITGIDGIDEKAGLIYYTAAYPTPMDRNFFVTDFAGKKITQLTAGRGWHRVELNGDNTKFYDYYSDINTPQTVTLYDLQNANGKVSVVKNKVVNESTKLKSLLAQYALGKSEFIRVPNTKGDTLNGWMLKPANFDPAKKYPVLFCNYGGPGSQQVANRFGAVSMWHQMLAQRGFIVVSVDNTGTGFRGEEFKKKTYLQLGKFEIEDQIDAAKWLAKMPFVDASNIGHWGWSFGGFMSSLAITRGADAFSAAVAVAPVTSWRYYDNIYTERYMRTPQENPKGYDDNSPINHVSEIRGKYLLIHGTGDDNVHFQNSVQMVKALVKANVDFETMYYPDKNHSISGGPDNTTYHLWSKMTNWILQNLGNENVNKTRVGNSVNAPKPGM
ncbi:S9 family peptidase [Flavisolibacter ginsenosidimutans]|uniref:S9 family peptidase n=1 Tax=Flavisolibacter ginsenosidimutans TaxID=661481 RepID=A0A5B8UG77_9BACT|nr:S9 family peptidase [Flavisolibacter ginsenosidimutans]QEC55503.1 S9 family peptidase [Flavisolibacter ginsenosidimutans]